MTFDEIEQIADELGLTKKPNDWNMQLGYIPPMSWAGKRVIETPQYQIIKLSNHIECSDEVREKFNAWALELFGTRNLVPDDNVVMFGDNIVMSQSALSMLNSAI